jgi:hypothetical protein
MGLGVGASAPSVSEAWPFGRLRANQSGVEGWQALGVGPQRKGRKDGHGWRRNRLAFLNFKYT